MTELRPIGRPTRPSTTAAGSRVSMQPWPRSPEPTSRRCCARASSRSSAAWSTRATRRSTARSPSTASSATCVYKPVAGERPLWDFPDGTLADREVATYVVSRGVRLGPRAADRVAATVRSGRACASSGSTSTSRSTSSLLARSDHPDLAPDGGARRRGQQRRPQGRAPAAARGRRGPGHRPRRDLLRRGQAPHPAVAVARRAAPDRARRRSSSASTTSSGRGSTARWPVSWTACSPTERSTATRLRVRRLLRAGTFPVPPGDWPPVPWPPF